MKIENITIESRHLHDNVFVLFFSTQKWKESYKYPAKPDEIKIVDNKPRLTRYGIENALLCFASDTLYNHIDGESYSLELARQDWEWIEDVIIRKHMKPVKRLYTNV